MKALVYPLLLAALTSACSSGPSKAELDAEVRRLCAIDGGVKVYETAPLTPELLDWAGRIRIPAKDNVWSNVPYYYEQTDTHLLLTGNPAMWRSHWRVYRRSDGKLMGESITYIRRGGDLPGPWHESSFSCPELGVPPYLEPSIFVKGGAQ